MDLAYRHSSPPYPDTSGPSTLSLKPHTMVADMIQNSIASRTVDHPANLPHYGASSEFIDRSLDRTETTAHSTHREGEATTL
ncbi:hypothetical protein E2C01_031567 [Portunus trituberculatus]|uniref:Uncharacterized protein n=1 Tax=Portunus trituberculatus TaxID=210409 RepID=A0A5B7EXY9_PORTR|nr:hypothetical protein [Portunus trituberculatus]